MGRRPKSAEAESIERLVTDHVAARIRLRRGLLGLSQSDLARSLQLTFQQVQKYERGSNRVSLGKLIRLAEVLDVPVTFFLDGLAELLQSGVRLSADQAGGAASPDLLSRRDLSLLQAWRAAPPEIADAAIALLRTVSFGEGSAVDGTDETADHAAEADPAPRRRRKRGAIWDPADVVGPKKRRADAA